MDMYVLYKSALGPSLIISLITYVHISQVVEIRLHVTRTHVVLRSLLYFL